MFEAGKFYAHDASEYEYNNGTEELLYCRRVTKYSETFSEAELIQTNGEGFSVEISARNLKWYHEISAETFANALLKAALDGKDYFGEEIRRRNQADIEERNNKAEQESPKFDL